ncbi:MAG: hypothetical protein IJI73_03700 [Kiritimatiellae bacterium]|nr:hypothetical protein [Kiritimatiellia bacterium]
MLTLIIAVLFASGCGALAYCAADLGPGWSIAIGVAGFAAFQAVFGIVVRKRVTRDMEKVQLILTEGQKRLQQKMQRWQVRPPGSIQEAQREIAADTRVFVKEALAQADTLSRYRLWIPMIDRQIATAKLQLNWMIKDWREVDALMPKALFLDPTMSAMKLARMQMLDAPLDDISKAYEKSSRRLKYNQNVLLAACYTWILVRRDKVDEAFKALTEALKNSDNDVLKRNHEELMNNRVAHFNNSGLGDQWYALGLEEPRVRAQRQRSVYR